MSGTLSTLCEFCVAVRGAERQPQRQQHIEPVQHSDKDCLTLYICMKMFQYAVLILNAFLSIGQCNQCFLFFKHVGTV